MWKLQHYMYFEENDYDVVVPLVFASDKIILEVFQIIPSGIQWTGWVSREIQSSIVGVEPPIKFYVNQKRYFNFDNYFPYKLNFKSNNYNIEKIHITLHEWLPLEFMNSQVVTGTSQFREVLPAKNHRTNWYVENQGESPLYFKWGEDGSEWELKPGKFISGESGKNNSLLMRGESICEFIESWEE